MKKSIFVALVGAAVLGLTSCASNPSSSSSSSATPSSVSSSSVSSSSPTLSSVISSSTSSSSSSSTTSSLSSTSSAREFTDDDLGLMKGHFIGGDYELDLFASSPRIFDIEYESYQSLTLLDLKTESYVSSTVVDSDNNGIEFTVDYLYFKESISNFQYRVYIAKEYSSFLTLEKLEGDSWKFLDSLYLWEEDFVGAWSTTTATAGFVRSAVFSDEFEQPFSDTDIRIPTGREYYGDIYWIPEYSTYYDYYQDAYVTKCLVFTYTKDDLSSEWSKYYIGESTDENYSVAIYDASFEMEYYYPNSDYYKGDWYTENGALTISQGAADDEVVFGDKTYKATTIKVDGYGWETELTSGDEMLSLRPFVGGFVVNNGTESYDVVSYDAESLYGTWLYEDKEIYVTSDWDDDWNEVLVVKVNDEVVETTFHAKDKKFAIGFMLDGKKVYLSSISGFEGVVSTLEVNGFSNYVCSKEVYTNYFVNVGTLISSNTIGEDANDLYKLTVNADFTVTYNSTVCKADYLYDETMGIVGIQFFYGDAALPYSLYMYDSGVYYLDLNDPTDDYAYLVFATESLLQGFVGEWTARGADADLIIDNEYNLVQDGVSSSVVFDVDSEIGFYMTAMNSSKTSLTLVYLSGQALADSVVGYNQAGELDVISASTYVKTEDYKKIEGTYIYVGNNGREYIVIDDSETVKITTSENGEYVLKDYTGNDIGFAYDGSGNVILAFYDENTNFVIYAYGDANNLSFTMFDELVYRKDVIELNQGYYSDGSNTLSIGGSCVYFNDTKATIESAKDGKLVFTASGTTYTATFADGVATITADGADSLSLNKGSFKLTDFAGTWEVSGTSYKLEATENTDGSILYSFTAGSSTYTDYQVKEVEGGYKVVFNAGGMTSYEITIDSEGNASLNVISSIPLPPPLLSSL